MNDPTNPSPAEPAPVEDPPEKAPPMSLEDVKDQVLQALEAARAERVLADTKAAFYAGVAASAKQVEKEAEKAARALGLIPVQHRKPANAPKVAK